MKSRLGGIALMLASSLPVWGGVLDDFNDNLKTGWTDSTFINGFGLPTESGGQFVFEQPPAGQAIFSASQKTTEVIELKDGRTTKIQVDLVSAGAKDSFAIVGFIPNTAGNTPLTLAGYGLAKSTTDILITKGINRYFVAESWPAELPNENLILSLTLTGKSGAIEILAQVLNKSANNAVVWEKRVVDTAAADVLGAGTDSPAAPFFTTGYATLYLYQDFDAGAPENPYRAVFDNLTSSTVDTFVLDDFNDNAKTDWTDSTFINGFGLPTEGDGKFSFIQPPAGQAIFSASQKTSRLFELKNDESTEFNVDVVQGGAKDSFSILAFIPNTGGNTPLTLAGYGLAKSTTDILITKGINRYFVAESWPAELANENITLSLRMTAKGGTVTVLARVLDKAKTNEVIWSRTVVDTAAADVLGAGTDSPAAPWLTTGYFTLYLYQDFDAGAPENPYQAIFDNAVVTAPPLAANLAPTITEISPRDTSNFLPTSTTIRFKAGDDKPLADTSVAVTLNGTRFTKANGLAVTGTGNALTVSLGGLVANVNYVAELEVTDSDNVTTRSTLVLDTFLASNRVIEIEDHNFQQGQFVNEPLPITEGSSGEGSYGDLAGIQGVDFNDTRTTANGEDTMYRTQDPIRMQRTRDNRRAKYDEAGGPDNSNQVFDYDVGDLETGEWQNYTRNFTAGSYEVYLREAVVNQNLGDSVLELVTGDRTQPDQTVRLLGTFLGTRTGFTYRNFPLTDGAGAAKVILRLSGETTLRLRHITADADDAARYLNYLVFVPVPDPGIQRATVSSLSPTPDSVITTAFPAIAVSIQNRDTTVVTSSVKLKVGGVEVVPTVTPTADGATVAYTLASLPAAGSVVPAELRYKDNLGVEQVSNWSFTLAYLSLDPATRFSGNGVERGFKVRVVQAGTDNGLLENSLQRAESQLAANSPIPSVYDTTVTSPAINFSQNAPTGGGDGFFAEDGAIPGQQEDFGTENYAMEIITFLELPAGVVRFGVNCDDGYQVASGNPVSAATLPLFFHNGGPANETADVVVTQAGLYPFRMVWYERSGGAHVEWFTVNPASGDRTLLNQGTIKAYATVQFVAPSVILESAAVLGGAFFLENSAVINTTAKTVSVARSGEARYYRLAGVAGLKLTSIEVQGETVQLKYSQP